MDRPAETPQAGPSDAKLPVLSASDIFRGRNVFILGSTGFVGKVLLSMLLDRFPQLGRAYVMVRRGSGTDSEARFWQSVVTSPAFNPLRDKHGGADGLAVFCARRSAWSTATSPSRTWAFRKTRPSASPRTSTCSSTRRGG
jgi:hypothetical protein